MRGLQAVPGGKEAVRASHGQMSSDSVVLVVIVVFLGIAVIAGVVAGVVAIGSSLSTLIPPTPADKSRLLNEIAPGATIPEGYEIVFGTVVRGL